METSITDLISGEAIDAYQNLSGKFQKDVDDYLRDNKSKRLYTRQDVVNAYLEWNGIIGYTHDVVELVTNCMKGQK
jgi:hypothetical protein